MANTKNINLRFNLEKESHKKAWEYLQNRDIQKFSSYSQTVITALTSFFDRYYEDPETSIKKHEDALIQRITNAVCCRLETSLPAYLAGYTAAKTDQPLQPPPPEKDSIDGTIHAEDIAWDFLQDV